VVGLRTSNFELQTLNIEVKKREREEEENLEGLFAAGFGGTDAGDEDADELVCFAE
jgi:hypothetical protein